LLSRAEGWTRLNRGLTGHEEGETMSKHGPLGQMDIFSWLQKPQRIDQAQNGYWSPLIRKKQENKKLTFVTWNSELVEHPSSHFLRRWRHDVNC
jgi:hypothetical protein